MSRNRRPAREQSRPAASSPGDTAATERRDARFLQAALAWQANRLDEAEALCNDVLAADRRYAPAVQLLAMIAAKTGRIDTAIAFFRDVVALDPRSVDARNQLVSLLRGELHFAEAIAVGRDAVRLAPDDAATMSQLGVCYLGARRLAEAIACFERAVALAPEVAALHYNLGHACQLDGREGAGATALARATELAPGLAEAHVRLGHLLQIGGNRDQAQRCFARALAALPESTGGRVNLARVFVEAGQLDAADRCVQQAIASDATAADAHYQRGAILRQLGRFDEAIASFRQVLVLQPNRADAYLSIAFSKRIGGADAPMFDTMTSLLGARELPERDRASLHYALGKAADDRAEYGTAIGHFDDANRIAAARLARSGRAIDRRRHADDIDRLIATFTPRFLTQHAALGSPSELPVLIVGMIRSGTTLIEQILSSHRAVGAGGELRFWGDRGARIGDVQTAKVDAAQAHELSAGYCRLLASIAPGALRVTDKMPTNFLLLGLIQLWLPRARIIHCRRHPVDTVLSMFFTPYTRSPDFAHDRGTLVFYYEQYLKLMAHWRAVLPPDRLLEVDYEDVVADRERAARRIVDFCGLPWDDACLRHEANARPVATPSQWQARQPVYRTSVARWRNYAPWLGEFKRLLPASDASTPASR